MGNNVCIKSQNLRNAEVITGSLKSLMDNCIINIYAGTMPANIDAALSGATLLAQICKGDASATYDLAFDGTVTNGILQKPSADTWSTPTGTGIATTGTAAFFVMNKAGDTNTGAAVSGTNYRIMGSVGVDPTFALFVPTVAFVSGVALVINGAYFIVN